MPPGGYDLQQGRRSFQSGEDLANNRAFEVHIVDFISTND